MTSLLTKIHSRDFDSKFRFGNSPVPLPEISRFNSAYYLDLSSLIYLRNFDSISLLYPGDFLFIAVEDTLFFNDSDIDFLADFLFRIPADVNFLVCLEYTDITSQYFEFDNDYFISPIFPFNIRNSNLVSICAGLFFFISSYPISFSNYNEYQSIMRFISNLHPVNIHIPLAFLFRNKINRIRQCEQRDSNTRIILGRDTVYH
jgi:hypothetical protein